MVDRQRAKFINKVLRMDSPSNDSSPEEESFSKSTDQSYVIALDIGTTSLRSHVYNKDGNIKGSSSKRIQLLHPKPGWTEMDPDVLIQQVTECIKESVRAARIKGQNVSCMGITVQRNTFITWDRETGKPFHNFITWQDLRARDTVKSWNNSIRMKILNNGSSLLHVFTRQKRFLAASVLRFMSPQVSMRLLWALENIDELKVRLAENQVMLGCIETYLVYKLTKEKLFATDYSCASGTGFFDPFQFEWSSIVCNLLNIPMSILPELRDTSGDFGHLDPSILGVPVPITAVVSDQTGAMFGQCCFDTGDIKCTMGTGTFVDVNTGDTPHASIAGLYPLVGWKIGDEVTFIAEGLISDTGIVIEWAKSIGMFDDVSEITKLAESVPDSGGVYYVGAFSGLQAPINDDKAVTTMIGLTPSTTKAHIVRAMLESIAFRLKILYETILTETRIPLSHIRADGGVCNNDFLMQLVADFTYQTIDRAKQRADMTSLGAAFLAGLAKGVWKSKDELRKIRQSERIFTGTKDSWSKYKNTFVQWERAVNRSKEWYTEQ